MATLDVWTPDNDAYWRVDALLAWASCRLAVRLKQAPAIGGVRIDSALAFALVRFALVFVCVRALFRVISFSRFRSIDRNHARFARAQNSKEFRQESLP